jgi:hypothetical protein
VRVNIDAVNVRTFNTESGFIKVHGGHLFKYVPQNPIKIATVRRIQIISVNLEVYVNVYGSGISVPAIILPVVPYTWFLTLREEHKLRVFESKVLRGIFGSKKVEVTGVWRGLHKEKLHNLYSSPSIIRMIKSSKMRLVRNVTGMRRKV